MTSIQKIISNLQSYLLKYDDARESSNQHLYTALFEVFKMADIETQKELLKSSETLLVLKLESCYPSDEEFFEQPHIKLALENYEQGYC